MKRPAFNWLPVVPLIFVILCLEFLVSSEIIPSFLVAAPSKVFLAFVEDSSPLWNAFFDTAISSGIGFVLSGIAGILLGVLLSSSKWIQRAFYPYAIFFQTVPIIAIAPLLVIWIGYGRPTVIASCFIVSVFPTIANTLQGMKSTDLNLLDLCRLYRASRWQSLTKVQLPFAMPSIFTGLKISAGLAVIGAIVGEFIAGGGLGGWIDVARTRQRVDQIFAALILASAIGLVFVGTLNLMSNYFLRHWHASEKD